MLENIDFLLKIIALIISFCNLIGYLKKGRDYLGGTNKPSANLLNEVIENEHIGIQQRNTAIRQLKKEYFYRATGLFIEDEKKRNMIMQLSEDSDGELPLFYFKSAYRFLDFSTGKIQVTLSEKDKRTDKRQKISSVVLLVIGTILLCGLVAVGKYQIMPIFTSVGCWGLALLVYMETVGFWRAQQIDNYLSKNQSVN